MSNHRPETMKVLGYCDRPSVAAGESLDFHVSCGGSGEYEADLVRLRHGDLAVDGPGLKLDEIPGSSLEGTHKGSVRSTPVGSFALFPEYAWLDAASPAVRIRVTPWSANGRETILHCLDEAGSGLVVAAEDGRFLAEAHAAGATAVVTCEATFQTRCWYELRVSVAGGKLALAVDAVGEPTASRLRFRDPRCEETRTASLDFDLAPAAARLWIGAAPAEREAPFARDHFNGKVEGPAFGDRVAVDFAAELSDPRRNERCSATGVDGTVEGRLFNLPQRGVTSSGWTSMELDYRHAPEQYAAIHFHADDLADADWPVSHTLEVPEDLPSGVYAARLRSEDAVDHVPFFVRPAKGAAKAPIALLFPTASYLAYANDKFGPDGVGIQLITGQVPIMQPESTYLHEHRELGSSLYDVHNDGSGVSISAWRRPLLNVRPRFGFAGLGVWQFNADLYLVDWLEEKGFEWDAITDHDLDAEGADLLRGYRTLVTGTHPEYWSGAMLDGLEAYLDEGGRLMYMGGNGLYWVTGFDPAGGGAVEIRRFGGTEGWTVQPGEARLQFTGEQGGLWRHRGRAPNRTTGVGFVAQALDRSGFYRRLDPELRGGAEKWVFEGVAGDTFGDFGLSAGGAAGFEIDKANQLLGTPPQTEILAASENHTETMVQVKEEIGQTRPGLGGIQNPAVRSDTVIFELENGGAVFSTGSIAWCGSLSHNGYDNAVSRVTENVLRRFSA